MDVSVVDPLPLFPSYVIEDEPCNLDEFVTIPPPDDEIQDGGHNCQSLELVNQMLVNDEIIFEEANPANDIPLFKDEKEDPSEAEKDDPRERTFAEDLEDYLTETAEDKVDNNGSSNSFHSTHQSMISSSSMANHLGGLDMNGNQIPKSNSSKRKTNDGDEDTASSYQMGAKKPRF